MNMQSDKKKLKRTNIARSCFELICELGFTNVSVSQIAEKANIGKGTVYEYFTNKEDIVFELMECLQNEYDVFMHSIDINKMSNEEFLLKLFDIFIDVSDKHNTKRKILKQFFIATITNPSEAILEYNKTLRDKYSTIIAKKLSNLEKSLYIYDFILGQYLLSLTIEIDLPGTVKKFIQQCTKE